MAFVSVDNNKSLSLLLLGFHIKEALLQLHTVALKIPVMICISIHKVLSVQSFNHNVLA